MKNTLYQLMHPTLNHLIVYAFLIIVLIIGLRAGGKNDGIKAYLLGNKLYGTIALILTLLATLGGSTIIDTSTEIFSDGIIAPIAKIGGFSLQYLFVAFFIAPKIIRFKESLTIGEIIEKLFNTNVRIVSSIINFIFCTYIFAIQLLALGFIFEVALELEKNIGIIFGGAIIMIYTAFGGIKSVTITDIVQIIIFIIIIPIVTIEISKYYESIPFFLKTISNIDASKFIIWGHPNLDQYIVLGILCFLPIISLSPPIVQRMLMANKKNQIKKMFTITGLFQYSFLAMIAVIGLGALTLPHIINPTHALSEVINQLISSSLIKSISIVGLLAIIMSTADSFLHAGSVTLIHDVVKPLYEDQKKERIIKEKKEIKFFKYSTYILATIAIFLAIKSDYITQLIQYALSILGLTITIPLLAGIMGLKTDAKSFFIAFFTALTVYFGGYIYLDTTFYYLIPLYSIIANAITFAISHYCINHGFKIIKLDKFSQDYEEKIIVFAHKNILKKLKLYLPNKKKSIQFFFQRVSKYGAMYELFATFCLLNYIVPYFMWPYQYNDYYHILFFMRSIAILLCIGLLLKNIWPTMLRIKYFPIYWYTTILYCLPFMATTTFLLTKCSTDWLVNIVLSSFLLIALTDWLMFIIILGLGVILSFGFYSLLVLFHVKNITSFPCLSTKEVYLLIYSIIFSLIIGFVFLRKKQKTILKQFHAIKNWGESISENLTNHFFMDIFVNLNELERLLEGVDDIKQLNIDPKKGYWIKHQVYKQAMHNINELRKIKDVQRKAIKSIKLMTKNTETDINFLELNKYYFIRDAFQIIYNDLSDEQKKNIDTISFRNFVFRGSFKKVKHIFYNLIKNVHQHVGFQGKIHISTHADKHYHILHFKDDGGGILAKHTDKIFKPFYIISHTESGGGIGLTYCKKIMEQLGGSIHCQSQTGSQSYTEFILKFPKIS